MNRSSVVGLRLRASSPSSVELSDVQRVVSTHSSRELRQSLEDRPQTILVGVHRLTPLHLLRIGDLHTELAEHALQEPLKQPNGVSIQVQLHVR